MVLFDKIMTSGISTFILDKINNLGIINETKFNTHKYLNLDTFGDVFEDNLENKTHFEGLAIDFMSKNKKSIINYLEKDLYVYYSGSHSVGAKGDFEKWHKNHEQEGKQSHFVSNIFFLGEIKRALSHGLYLVNNNENIYFYNGRLSYVKSDDDFLNRVRDDITYILQLDLSPEINEFPIPNSIEDVIFLRNQPAIVSFREVFFTWIEYIKKGKYDLALKIKKDVLTANNHLAKYNKWEKQSKNLFFCAISAVLGQIPYLSNLVGAIAPYMQPESRIIYTQIISVVIPSLSKYKLSMAVVSVAHLTDLSFDDIFTPSITSNHWSWRYIGVFSSHDNSFFSSLIC